VRRVVLTLSALIATGLVLTACGERSSPSPWADPPIPPIPQKVEGGQTVTRYWPLTGFKVRSNKTAKLDHRVLVAKMDNTVSSRPQVGLSKADMVVEELVEGGLTRLMAVFQCDNATNLGPIRSARSSDADMLALLHGSVFGYSGANPRAIPPIRAHCNTVLLPFDDLPQYFHRVSSRPAPHNVFSDTDTILKGGLARRHNLTAPKPLFTYGDPSATATPATSVAMSWPDASAAWRWNGSSWLRTQNGTPDVLTNGARVKADNVVVMQIRIGSTGIRDVAGNSSPLDVTIGSGKVWVFRDGNVIAGTWHRATIGSQLRFVDAAGAPIALHPGRTWVELLPRPRLPKIA
jgi:hypothetical protein